MIKHYLKIAFRNLRKYKSQTLISVIGLAVGFTCFTVSALWIRYEMTFDGFLKNADRIYCLYLPDHNAESGFSRMWSLPPLATNLKSSFPEIKNVVAVKSQFEKKPRIEIDNIECQADLLQIDSSFFTMFDVGIIEGNKDFLIPENKKIAVTITKARQLFGNEKPIGKVVKLDKDEYTIGAIVNKLPKHSNYPFDFLYVFPENSWGKNLLIELNFNVDVENFKKKLYEHKLDPVQGMIIVPITAMHYESPDNTKREIKFQYIIVFAISGLLVILCALFNYLALFINRLRIRQKEFAIRKISGASVRSLLALVSVEYVLLLITALLLGMAFIRTVLDPFRRLYGIELEISDSYSELLIYIGLVSVLPIILFLLPIALQSRNLNTLIHRGNKKLFRKVSVVVQLAISIVFTFCTIVIVKQMSYMHNTDLGFAFKNRGAIRIQKLKIDEAFENHIKQIPEITETVMTGIHNLLPLERIVGYPISEWDDKPENAKEFTVMEIQTSPEYEAFYEFRLLEGEMLNDGESKRNVLISETAVKIFGWNKPVGKSFDFKGISYTVKGVVKDIYLFTPSTSAQPIYLRRDNTWKIHILFKYREGTWKTCKNKIERMIKEKYPEVRSSDIYLYNSEEEYDKFLKSENALLKILTFVSSVCLLICLFGFVSTVSLTCEERRKEIAIRKINGATVKDILDIFFREYLILLAVGALVAFPVGHYVMKKWLEQYVLQTEISAWIYLSILLVLILAIVLCVGGKVYKTGKENPVEALKS